ncbi:MAG: hypothetical protein U0325_31100 [Polyangiales bacterium]
MRYDPESLTLRFASRDELDRFHRDLGDLLRRAVTAGVTPDEDPVVGATGARRDEGLRDGDPGAQRDPRAPARRRGLSGVRR